MHPRWFRSLLTRSLDQPRPLPTRPKVLTTAWQQFTNGDYEGAVQTCTLVDSEDALPASARCELGLLKGMATFRLGRPPGSKVNLDGG